MTFVLLRLLVLILHLLHRIHITYVLRGRGLRLHVIGVEAETTDSKILKTMVTERDDGMFFV